MTEFATFGDPARFEIAVRWIEDREPRSRLPADGGWSTGDLRLTVGGNVLTRHIRDGAPQEAVRWYLFPVFEWLADNWAPLLHGGRFPWSDNSAAPAATSAFYELRRLAAATDPRERKEYALAQDWRKRHALRAADSSALYPDVFFRRLTNDVEVSWTARQPAHAPDGFRFETSPGVAVLPVGAVAEPLWRALQWCATQSPADLSGDDQSALAAFSRRLAALQALSPALLESEYLSDEVYQRFSRCFPDGVRLPQVPAIDVMSDEVLMFGGVAPDIGVEDGDMLLAFLSTHRGGTDGERLCSLVDPDVAAPLGAAYEEGYDRAEDVLDEFNLPGAADWIDVRGVAEELGVLIEEKTLRTDSVRGLAVAGNGYAPAILINAGSFYNGDEAGKRFTIAHELFHILFDRGRARRLAHASGPWAPPGTEKRANAFAAMLLMPRPLVRRLVPTGRPDWLQAIDAATTMHVGVSALIEHLYNINLIDDAVRASLRDQHRKASL